VEEFDAEPSGLGTTNFDLGGLDDEDILGKRPAPTAPANQTNVSPFSATC